MTTKRSLCKQIIVSIGNKNIITFMKSFSEHMTNINYVFKSIKSDNFVDFICSNHQDLIINSNKVNSLSDLLVVELYIKDSNSMNAKDIKSAYLSQSKLYLKILSILYLIEGTNILIDASVMESIIKSTHVFNNIRIASKPRIVKVSPKSNITIIWIDI